MLYLEPPLHMIEGVSVFRDHADPLQWYYLPIGPRLTTLKDPAGGQSIPQLQLIKFRGTAGNGGFLNFDVDLAIDPDVLDEVAREVKSRESLDGKPRLAPVPLVDGSVRLLLFDHEGEPPEGDEPPPPGEFVLEAEYAAKPALYGDNRAAFSVELSQRGVTILEKALQGEISPIGIVYSLDFLALRPAYNVRVEVDWDRVQHHLEEHFRVSVPLIYQSQIDEIVDELIESQAIVIEVDTFVPEGDDSGGVLARRDQAVADVQDMITESFFKPSLDPIPRQDGTDSDLRTAQRVIQMVLSGGVFGGDAAFSYSKTDIKRIDHKRLDVNMRERTTVKRSIYPQGHLSGLFRLLRDGGADLNRFVIEVDTDDPWFQRRKVHVISRADFTADSIGSVDVRLEYGSESHNLILDASHPEGDLEWASILDGGAMRREVGYRYIVKFQGVEGSERPLSLESPQGTTSVENLEIVPRDLYSLEEIPILALNFPWERYSHVEVVVRYSDPENGIRQQDDFLLDKDHPGTTWKMFIRDPEKTRFEYKVIFRGVDHRDLERGWAESDDERILVRDPFPRSKRLSLSVVPVFDWNLVDRAFVDLEYEDDANGIHEEESFEFTAEKKESRTFEVDLEDPENRLVSYRVTVISKTGEVVEVPTSYTLERRITVRGDMRGHRVVRFLTGSDDFSAKKIREILVEARYEDEENGLSFADDFILRSPGVRAHFEYDYAGGGPESFQYRVVRRFTNGLTRETPWTSSSETELVIPVGNQ